MNSGNIVYVNLEELSKVDYKLGDGEANITGWPVVDESERSIGKVRDLLIDVDQNAVRYVIVDLDDAISRTEEKAVLFPIGFIRLADGKKEVVLPNMHEDQFIELPQYIIGELTRDTELKIRSAIGSPAALRMEEEITALDQGDFYRNHHFERGSIVHASQKLSSTNEIDETAANNRKDEESTIHELIDQAKEGTFVTHEHGHPAAGRLEQFDIYTEEGIFTIDPQENGTYRVFEKEEKIGVIYAESTDDGTQWRTLDKLDDQFVIKLGEKITSHNLSKPHN